MIINQLELIINDYFAEILSNFFHAGLIDPTSGKKCWNSSIV